MMSANDTTKPIDFTEQEKKIGRVLYYILVICIIASVAGLGWTILDIIQPTGKFSSFLQDNAGLKLVFLGIAAFILFLMLISFYGMRRRGTGMITRVVFTTKRVYRDMHVPKIAQFTTGGLIVSIFVMALGGIWLMVQIVLDYAFGTTTASGTSAAPKLLMFFDALSTGELFMVFSLFCLCMVFIVILFAWLGNAGNIFFARTFLKIPISQQKYNAEIPGDNIQVKAAKQTLTILALIFGFAGVGLLGYSLKSVLSGDLGYFAIFSNFHHWLETVSFFAGFAGVVYLLAFFFSIIARQKHLSVILILSCVIGIMTAVYIDLWRPLGDAWDATTFLNFRILIVTLECIGMGGYVIIVIAQVTTLKNALAKAPGPAVIEE